MIGLWEREGKNRKDEQEKGERRVGRKRERGIEKDGHYLLRFLRHWPLHWPDGDWAPVALTSVLPWKRVGRTCDLFSAKNPKLRRSKPCKEWGKNIVGRNGICNCPEAGKWLTWANVRKIEEGERIAFNEVQQKKRFRADHSRLNVCAKAQSPQGLRVLRFRTSLWLRSRLEGGVAWERKVAGDDAREIGGGQIVDHLACLITEDVEI